MHRREFAALVPTLLAGLSAPQVAAAPPLPVLESGAFKPRPPKTGSVPKRASQAYTRSLLKAGNIQVEIHETRQEVGAPHEPIDTHCTTRSGWRQAISESVLQAISTTPKTLATPCDLLRSGIRATGVGRNFSDTLC